MCTYVQFINISVRPRHNTFTGQTGQTGHTTLTQRKSIITTIGRESIQSITHTQTAKAHLILTFPTKQVRYQHNSWLHGYKYKLVFIVAHILIRSESREPTTDNGD